MRAGSRVVAVLLGWLLVVLCGPTDPVAVAAPPGAREPVAPKVGGRRNSLGELTAADEVSARAMARIAGERVEVVGSRSEFSSTWALPDGSLASGQAAGPLWVRAGGSGRELEDWIEVDLDLVRGADGWVRPKGHPADLRFAGGSDEPVETLAVASDRDRSEDAVSLGWDRALPEPRLAGPRATYMDVSPGVDLVLEATRTGFEQFFVIRERPEKGAEPDLGLPLRASGRFALRGDGGDAAAIMADGSEVARVGRPHAWDARLDQEREHPVTRPWQWASPGVSGLARSLGEPREWDEAKKPDLTRPETAPEKVPLPRDRRDMTPRAPEQKAAPVAKEGRAPEGVEVPHLQPTLPLSGSVSVASSDEARVELGLDQEFLDDPATVYPVVVDPDVAFAWGFDTWVSQDWKYTDKSGETFLRVGGVPGTARTFIHFGVGPFAGKQVLAADISLWATWSYSCQPRNWELWDTSFASTGTRWGAQPAWYSKWSVSDETQGYSSACGDGWVTIDAQALAQAWADNGHLGDVALGLKAENESDPYALKEFNSANAGDNVPTLWVRYNTRPTPSTDLAVAPSNVVDGVVYTNHATPSLSAIGHDPDGDWLSFVYRLHRGVNGPQLWQTTRTGEQGVAVSVPVSAHGGSLVDGESYDYVVHAADSSGAWNTHYSDWKRIVADLTPPPAPVSVTSSTYPSDTGWHGDVGVAGAFTVALGAGEANPHGFIWAVDGPPVDTNRVLGSDFSWTPSAAGRHVLNVRAIDKAGNLSPVVSYPFNVGRGAIVSPMEGTRVVRRARLEIQADPTLTDVRFEWRAGPDASAIHAVPAGVLSTASGAPFGADRIALSTLGSYATLDAAALLGFRRGPFQVRPVFRAGTGPDVQGAWVSLFVDPDADGASADQVGPGGVNLITGDYTLSSEDADEFGVLVGRTASSRDPRAGFQPQAEILSASQRTISDVTGFESDAALFEKVTDRWHAGGDGLRVRPLSLGTNTFVSVGGDVGGVRLGLKGGSTYRFTGWAYVPAATGLSPDHAERGLRLAAFTRVGSDPYQWTLSEKVQATDTWQFLSVDFTVPEGVTEAFVRVYNGFQQGSGKEVFYDDLSLRELWAPVGPQWSLGSADDAAGTDYEKVERPDEETVVVHTAGGGEIWFTAAGSGAWVPELGAEGLVLTSQGDDWTLSELDGTVTHFSPATAGGPALMTTTAPPAAAGQTRMVYQGEAGITRLHRIVAPTEPGINQAQCVSGTPARGCEVTEFTYAPASQAKPGEGEAGEFPKQLSRVEVWSTNPASGAVEKQTVVEYRYDSAGRLTQMWDPRVTPALKTVYGYDQAGHVTSLTPAGELPWRFAYAAGGQRTSASGDLIDANPGRLQSVTRASLVEGSASQAGPDNTTTVLYGVPLARADGGPYNLDENALGSWAQRGAPTDATAVFGPHAPPSVTEPTASAPGADGYATATVHYLDASGREVNTASPIGGTGVDANLKRIGFIDSAEFDQYGNTIRTLDATNRLIALGVGATASADLLELNLASMPTAERALRLSATSTYSADGLDLLSSVGPAQRVSTAAGMEVVRLRTANTYDEGKPDAQAYHLVTTSTTSAQPVDHPNDPSRGLDSVTTRTGYAPTAQLGGTSGWVVKKPTSVTCQR